MATTATRDDITTAEHKAIAAITAITSTRTGLLTARLRSNSALTVPALPCPTTVTDPDTRLRLTITNQMIARAVEARNQPAMARLCLLLAVRRDEISADLDRIRAYARSRTAAAA